MERTNGEPRHYSLTSCRSISPQAVPCVTPKHPLPHPHSYSRRLKTHPLAPSAAHVTLSTIRSIRLPLTIVIITVVSRLASPCLTSVPKHHPMSPENLCHICLRLLLPSQTPSYPSSTLVIYVPASACLPLPHLCIHRHPDLPACLSVHPCFLPSLATPSLALQRNCVFKLLTLPPPFPPLPRLSFFFSFFLRVLRSPCPPLQSTKLLLVGRKWWTTPLTLCM